MRTLALLAALLLTGCSGKKEDEGGGGSRAAAAQPAEKPLAEQILGQWRVLPEKGKEDRPGEEASYWEFKADGTLSIRGTIRGETTIQLVGTYKVHPDGGFEMHADVAGVPPRKKDAGPPKDKVTIRGNTMTITGRGDETRFVR